MKQQGLYRNEMEHDSCGIGFVAHLKGEKSHNIIRNAIVMLQNMKHRGAVGSEPNSGDGAGIMLQVPHQFLLEECETLDIHLPNFGGYGVGMIFFPKDDEKRERCRELFNKYIDKLDLELIGYREVPTNRDGIGSMALSAEPKMEQVFIKFKEGIYDPEHLERRLFILRKYATHNIWKKVPGCEDFFYIASMSYKTIVYKGQLTTHQLITYFPDLQDERLVSALALIHSRFSTNTFPKWKLAQPFDYIAHNGEINTIRGNVNWMRSKEKLLESKFYSKEELERMVPVCDAKRSDSGNLDSIIEFLVFGGRSLPHAMMMLIPEAWQGDKKMEESKRAFYEYYASMMEPWDGPASICFTDGKVVGATLDRNGLRPSRYLVTEDDLVVMASEAGALPVDQSKVLFKGRLQPGRMFVADLEQGRIISDEELKKVICSQQPYQKWLDENRVLLDELPKPDEFVYPFDESTLAQRQVAYGFTSEDLRVILGPMVEKRTEPIGSMGADIPLAVLSNQSQHLSNYFKQLFAQVSNPPIDPIREKSIMSLYIRIGNFLNIFSETPAHCKQIQHYHPVLTNQELECIRNIDHPDFKCKTINLFFEAEGKPGRLEKALNKICKKARSAVRNGHNILLLSDRLIDEEKAPIPTLLAVGAIHHDLIENGLRAKTGMVVEAGDVRETHHFATLVGYGANAVNPYMAFETLLDMKRNGQLKLDLPISEIFSNYIDAINYGLRKILSKMGISTLQSYLGAQIFEAVGLSKEVINRCFVSTVSRIEGLTFDDIAKEVLVRHREAFGKLTRNESLEVGGIYQWKRRGEFHLFNPDTIHLLQQSAWKNDYSIYKEFAEKINDQSEKACTLRSLFRFKKRKPVPIEEVEPKENIFRRFATGAMSFGSISHEAHSTLAIAMNRIGGKSNSGEGGEDEIRFEKKPNGDWECSAIKQVASGRFGVTSYYLTNAQELQIKMAQGAKPGEGGQLPGHKVDEWIGRVRHSTPGVGLISPPPHHDIYSIEDLAQLIFDLKNANRDARINVKLVAETGVGTIAAGVAKAKADVILISGQDGGTGASPWSSIRHAGLPWELGVAEAHQTLVKNNLRSRVVLQTDGQIRTGRDLAIAALLGAEEWGVATAALVVEGCILMRKCHLNTCPVGVATQDPRLRKMFKGKPEYVVNYITFLAEDLREIMAELGFRTVDEMVGQVDALKVRENIDHWKSKTLNLKPVLYKQPAIEGSAVYHKIDQDHELGDILDWQLLQAAREQMNLGKRLYKEFPIESVNRAVGALLSNQISKIYKGEGLPEGTLHYKFRGSAGQSFGAFTAHGVRFELEGEANDYFGKGLSGAQLIIYPDRLATFKAEDNIIIGNVAFYGATSGEAYINGQAGERFCVRNSGVKAVVEGVGDHGCEYMTGGRVVILGETGKNFAAGMSGGIAYIFDKSNRLEDNCNMEMVDIDPLDEEDVDLLERLIKRHHYFTNSEVAKGILDTWTKTLDHFKKVMPRDYKAILQQQEEEAITKNKIAV